MRPIEDADLSSCGKFAGVPPEIVVRVFLVGGDLETGHVHALRVHAAHHVTDGAVLTGAVDPLQAQQHAVRILSRQATLVRGEELHAL